MASQCVWQSSTLTFKSKHGIFGACRQQISALQTQLKHATVASKGGDKAKQMAEAEAEKTKKKLGDVEAKLRNANADKGQVRLVLQCSAAWRRTAQLGTAD